MKSDMRNVCNKHKTHTRVINCSILYRDILGQSSIVPNEVEIQGAIKIYRDNSGRIKGSLH